MSNALPFIDASLFLGMHHSDPVIRTRSVNFFLDHYPTGVRMNFEQIGICDSIIWQQPRLTQDDYYPFMDVLHTDMSIIRQGYDTGHLQTALSDDRIAHLRTEQKLLVAQVLASAATLYTHDPALRQLRCLADHLGEFDDAPVTRRFPGDLDALYQRSTSFSLSGEEWSHVD
ncbi:DUF6190 family protein [Burkholderia sp. JP2-270]|uniref:DUF6190 family protein n=1 Tax=Burkholderia sp. JP2-270 TaxID=2217913 RepID=UPI001EF76049|nr:DUF6190 family protein [Burkholderia sp. JP2-270]